ncbi:MAG: hypothetical protein ACYDA3_10585 [Gaiellaceae bacterium]
MRKLTLALIAIVALVATSIAVANGFEGTRTAEAVAGTFAATTVTKNETQTCTSSDGKTIARTNASYTGTATGPAELTGPATVELHALVNTTDDVGAVSGTIKIDTAANNNTVAHFDAVYDHGKLAGLAIGHAGDAVKFVGNLSSGFSPAGGLTDGKLGASAGGSAIELGPGKCVETKPERSSAEGTVSAVSSTSITVAGLTCSVPSSLQAQVANVKVGDRAAIRCEVSNGTTTLVKLDGKGDLKVHAEARLRR